MREFAELREMIRALVRNLSIVDKSEASCCGVTVSQCHAMLEVAREQPVSLQVLSDQLQLDKSTTSRTVDSLVTQGLLQRNPDPADRRYVNMKLTPNGDEMVRRINLLMDDYYRTIYLAIPQESRQQVMESLRILNQVLENNKCC
ncbi:MAG: MarR family winged helix-turn-helix transcriptional regulator [Syntrophomonadales bacterium]|jgi:DNA-binding MarR family transcriptional regulator